MAKPTLAVRLETYDRDGHRCVSCGRRDQLEYQHRRVEGMGGRLDAPAIVDGLTTCPVCNRGYEGVLQASALRYGWKVRSWVIDRGLVPVFYPMERRWFRLLDDGARVGITFEHAMEMMHDVYGNAYDPARGLVA
jgi:hypothetical protein